MARLKKGALSGGAGLTDGIVEKMLNEHEGRLDAVEQGGGGGGPVSAVGVSFAPAGGLVSTNVQTAIEELESDVDTKLAAKATTTALTTGLAGKTDTGTTSTLAARVTALEASPIVTLLNFPTGADHYDAPTGVVPGAASFLVACWMRFRRGFDENDELDILEQTDGGSGWGMKWNFGNFCAYTFDGLQGIIGPNFGTSEFWGGGEHVDYMIERDALVVLRVVDVAGTANLSVIVNGAQLASMPGDFPGITPGTVSALRVGGDSPHIAVQGLAYKVGTLTDDQLDTWMDACFRAGGIVPGAVTWDNGWSTVGTTPGASWAPFVGAVSLTRAGAPTTMTRRIRLA